METRRLDRSRSTSSSTCSARGPRPRLDLHRRLAQRAALGLAVVLAGAALVPILASQRAAAVDRSVRAAAALATATTEAEAKEARASVVRSEVERAAEILASAKKVDALLSGIATVLNVAPETLVVRSLAFDVAGGVLTIKIRAEAPDGDTARLFARRVGDAPGIQNSKASSIVQNGDRGGVSFDITSTGSVTP